jgi:hypothetical protein
MSLCALTFKNITLLSYNLIQLSMYLLILITIFNLQLYNFIINAVDL